jgi:hypothetical protein
MKPNLNIIRTSTKRFKFFSASNFCCCCCHLYWFNVTTMVAIFYLVQHNKKGKIYQITTKIHNICIPDDHKIHMLTFSIPKPSKIYPNLDFLFEICIYHLAILVTIKATRSSQMWLFALGMWLGASPRYTSWVGCTDTPLRYITVRNLKNEILIG